MTVPRLERRQPDRVPTVEANAEALRRIMAAQPILVDLKLAGEVIPELAEHDLLHAGPPLKGWQEAGGALRGSTLGALVHLGMAKGLAKAEALAGQIGAGFARTPLECFRTALAELEVHA